MTRLQKILTMTLVIQLALTAVVFWPHSSANADGGALFPDLNINDIVRFSLEDGDGQRTELLHQDDIWVLADSGGYPADKKKIEPVLAKIATIRTNRLIARSNASHKRLQVADDAFTRRIEMEMKDGTILTLLAGTSPNPRATHVRQAGQSETYLAGNLSSWELAVEARNWIDPAYITLDREAINQIVLKNGNGVFTFKKEDDDAWTLVDLAEDREFNQDNFNAILNQVANLNMVRPLGQDENPAYGFDSPQATLTITLIGEDGSIQTHTLYVGAQLDDGAHYAVKWSDSPYYASAASYSVENMIKRTQADFIKEPPTPMPDGA